LFAVVTALLLAIPPASADISFGSALSGSVPTEAAQSAQEAKIPAASVETMQRGGLAGVWAWMAVYAGKGGMILWPMFGATNQLLGGLAFLVICFWLWRRRKPVWFIVLPTVFMLVMPAWAMLVQVGGWYSAGQGLLVFIAVVTLVLEAWMLVEAALMWPRTRGVLERSLPPLPRRQTTTTSHLAATSKTSAPAVTSGVGGPNC